MLTKYESIPTNSKFSFSQQTIRFHLLSQVLDVYLVKQLQMESTIEHDEEVYSMWLER